MKRQTQVLGVRNWYGDAFVSLQEEPLKVIDGFFSQYGAFVLSGCEVKANGSKYDIAPGLVVLEGAGANNATVKVVVPFAGITATALPVYLTLGYETETDVYNDGNVKPIAHIYKAVATTVKPAGSYVQITQAGGVRFIDAIQDATHRFITDNERINWNGKASLTDVEGVFKYDYIVDSNSKLAALHNNDRAINVLIKAGTWTATSQIGIHSNCRTITAEPGSKIVVNLSTGTGTSDAPLAALYALNTTSEAKLSNVTAEITAPTTVKYTVVFKDFNTLTGCTAFNNQSFSGTDRNICRGFLGCANLTDCRAVCNVVSMSGSKGVKGASGFSNCSTLFHCSAIVSCRSDVGSNDTASADGFSKCKFCTNCSAVAEGTENKASVIVFSFCDFLNNCNAVAKGNGQGNRVGFQNCKYLTNCQGETAGYTASYSKNAFVYCENLTQCDGISTSREVSGFWACEYMTYCTANMAGFSDCHVGYDGSTEVANTQAGGWNRVL